MDFTQVLNSQAIASYREEAQSNTIPFLGESFFPNQKQMGLDIKWMKTYSGLNAVLAPSNFDAIPTVRSREGFKFEHTELAFFRESMTVKEQDMMNIQRAQSANDPYVDEALAHIFDDAGRLMDAADLAVEKMRMQLLATNEGTPTISISGKDNMIYTYNYDPDGTYKANNYMKLMSGATWDNADTAKPLDDVRTATKALKAKGHKPVYALMSAKTFDYLVLSEQMKNVMISVAGNPIVYMDEDTVKDLFRRKTGLTPVVYEKSYVDYDGTQKNFYPDDKITIICEGTLGKTVYGVTPEERTLFGDSTVDVSIVGTGTAVTVKTQYGPPTQIITTVSQLVVPSYEGIAKTYVIDVK